VTIHNKAICNQPVKKAVYFSKNPKTILSKIMKIEHRRSDKQNQEFLGVWRNVLLDHPLALS